MSEYFYKVVVTKHKHATDRPWSIEEWARYDSGMCKYITTISYHSSRKEADEACEALNEAEP